jgi:hypothetical protein
LTYATAQVVRNERREGFDGGSGGASSAPRAPQNSAPAGYDMDEEPF